MTTGRDALRQGPLGAGAGSSPARPLVVSRSRTSRRIVADRWASRLVVIGGLVVIASILGILVVIAAEVYPLFRPASATLLDRVAAPGGTGLGGTAVDAAPGDSTGVDEYRQIAYAIGVGGMVTFTPLHGSPVLPLVAIPLPADPSGGADRPHVTFVTSFGKSQHLIGTSDGRAIPLDMKFDVTFKEGRRLVAPEPVFGEPSALDPDQKRPLLRLATASPSSGALTVAQVGPSELVLQAVVEKKALIGGTRREESRQTITVPMDGEITAMRLDGRGDDLFLGTSRGQILQYDLRDRDAPRLKQAVAAAADSASITALGFLIGDRTLVVGDRSGAVSTWQVVPPVEGGEPRLVRVHRFAGHARPVTGVNPSKRDKGFVTVDEGGEVRVHHGTTGQSLLTLHAAETGLRSVVFAPKSDGLVALDSRGGWTQWDVHNPHPEVTLGAVFGKVWYEGYSRPEFVWQSTGGTDDFEPKLGLTPLIFGTLKGTFYALLFAVPMALLAALHVSEFMHPTAKAYVKPVVEIMAALPSVVLGFLAGLWLAPMVERIVPGLFVFPFLLPVFVLLAFLGWHRLPRAFRGRFRAGSEAVILVPVVLVAVWAALALGGLGESALLGGNYRGWLLSALGLTYDQRNSLVVGVAMGFAVIPIIFTIAEDSLANVPQHLRAGSLALGATRWQTALRIVLPTASPGIFSAIMIGFGRAVGETMIVLMATGNTPVMDWSIFNGFRALSANIAVELPEAPEGGTLFRVLFLAAFLLFCLTFAVNTVAELVRLRLRRRFRYL